MRRELTVTKPALIKPKEGAQNSLERLHLHGKNDFFHFPHLVSPANLLQNRHSYRNFALFIPRGNKVTKTLVHTTS